MYQVGAVESVLIRLGIPSEQTRDELLSTCPMHLERTGKQDANPSWSINTNTGVHHCFSCGYKGTLLSLIAELLEFKTQWGRLDIEASKSWLLQYVEVDFEALSKELESLKNAYTVPNKPIEMSEARLSVFDRPPQWAREARNLSELSCDIYSVRWDHGKEAWITPIRHPHTNKLLGWQEKGQVTKSFRNRPTGIVKSSTLFGSAQASGADSTLVVESPLDVLRLHTADLGIMGVATFGSSVSEDQYLLMSEAKKLIVAFDNPNIDKAGEVAASKLYDITRLAGLECWFFNYKNTPETKDIGDMSSDQIQWGIDNALHCVYGKSAIYGR